jgi:hypothetical protein
MTIPSTEQQALDYIAKHEGRRYIFPIRRGRKYPPLIKDNLAQASNDPGQIKAWHKKWPGCAWGLSHKKSGVLVADIDKDEVKGKIGQQTFDDLDLMYTWPATEITTTPTGGEHRIHIGEHITAFGIHGFGEAIDSPNYTLIPGCNTKDGEYVSNGKSAVAAKQWMYDVINAAKTRSNASRAEGFDDPVPLDMFKQMLDATPYTGGPEGLDNRSDDQNGWFNHMAAVHEASGGDNGEYRDLYIEWCLNDPNGKETWTAESIIPRWDSLNAKKAGGITRASWEKVLLFFGNDDLVSASQPDPDAEEDFTEAAEVDALPTVGDPKKIEAAKRDREKARESEAARPDDQKARLATKQDVIDGWLWVGTLERFFNRADPKIIYKKDAFNDKFAYLTKGPFAKALFTMRKGTILKPDRVVYKPKQAEFLKNGSEWNQWRPSPIVAAEGDTKLWDNHLAYLFPDKADRDHVLNWLAGVIQFQEVKPMHALLLIGRIQGTGKSFIFNVLAELLGRSNWQPLTQDILANGFTGWATRTKLVTVEELRAVSKTEISKKVHPWITQVDMTVNEKNLPTFVIDQVIAFGFMSNQPDAIEIDNSDRRYLVVETKAQVHPDGQAYYHRLYGTPTRGKGNQGGVLQDPAALGAILYALENRDLKGYSITDRAPDTAAKIAMKAASANDIAQWMTSHSGEAPFNYQVVTLDEIVLSLPSFMKGRVSMKTLREAMEYHKAFNWPVQIRPNATRGGKISVWLQGEAAEQARGGLVPDVLSIYRAERRNAVVKADPIPETDAELNFGTAEDDFGFSGTLQ